MKNLLIALALIGLAASFVFGFYAFNLYIYEKKQGSEFVAPYEATLSGEYVCLPHKGTGPVTLECAFGLKTDVGEYYALDTGEPTEFVTGQRATLTGTITPIENISTDFWQKYDIRGIFSIKSELPADLTEHINSKKDLIVVTVPAPLTAITSPLKFSGKARGTWFFEASFPVILVDWDGRIIAESYATAILDPNDPNSTWMTEDFVPFEGTIEFTDPSLAADFSKRGALIFRKDNPSGLPENDDALEIPIYFAPAKE